MARRRYGRRRRGHGMPEWRKWARMGVGIFGKVVGAGVALSPTFRGFRQIIDGNVEQGFDSIAYDTTGAIPSQGQGPGIEPVLRTVVTVGVGIGIMKLFGYVARRI